MNANEFRRFHGAQPFTSYVIHVVDGREFKVTHPDFAMLGPEDETVHVLNSDNLIELLSLSLIVSLQPLKEKKTKPGK